MRFLGVLLLTLTMLMVGPQAQAEDPVVAEPTRTIVLDAPTGARFTEPTTLTATVANAEGPLAAQTVRFEQLSGETWVTMGEVATDETGVARFEKVTRRASSFYRAVLVATETEPEVVSEVREVIGYKVKSRIELTANAWYVPDEKARALTVTWEGGGDPINAVIQLQSNPGNGVWTTIMRGVTGEDGLVRFVVRPRVDTYYRALGRAGAWWQADRSVVRHMDNRPPIAPVSYPAAAPRPVSMPANQRAIGAGPNPVIMRIPDGIWRSMVGRSWHRGCPLGRAGLRLIRINYFGYNGYRYRGELVVNAAIAGKTVGALRDMYAGRYPIHRMFRVDRFGWSSRLQGADDYKSMARGNTSAFNCRGVVGNPSVRSPHSWGRAVDINTWENPYVSRDGIVPNRWWHYRSHPKIAWRTSDHPVVRIWRDNGFRWTYGNNDAHHYDGRVMSGQVGTMVG